MLMVSLFITKYKTTPENEKQCNQKVIKRITMRVKRVVKRLTKLIGSGTRSVLPEIYLFAIKGFEMSR